MGIRFLCIYRPEKSLPRKIIAQKNHCPEKSLPRKIIAQKIIVQEKSAHIQIHATTQAFSYKN